MKKYKAKTRPTILAIDFDGTIVSNNFPAIGEPIKDAKEIINTFYEEGYYIIIWTCRGGEELVQVRDFLDNMGIKYHKINENADFDIIGFMPFPKIYCDICIDDKNLGGIPSWKEIYTMVTEYRQGMGIW